MSQEEELIRGLSAVLAEIERDHERRILPSLEVIRAREARKLFLERKLAAIRNEEYADEIELGAPVKMYGECYLCTSFGSSLVLCESHGLSVEDKPTVAVVFWNCYDSRFDRINDEVMDAHPLYGKGLGVAGLFIVRNSRWRAEMMKIMETHTCFNAQEWQSIEHYMLRMKAGGFSFLADRFTWHLVDRSMLDIRRKYESLQGPTPR